MVRGNKADLLVNVDQAFLLKVVGVACGVAEVVLLHRLGGPPHGIGNGAAASDHLLLATDRVKLVVAIPYYAHLNSAGSNKISIN